MSFFSAENLSAGYSHNLILNNISFDVEKGSLTGILGANGSGKTTLLKAICGLLPHTGICCLNGKKLDGMPTRELSRICSYIPQRSGITVDIPVLDVVLMGFNPHLKLLEQPDAAMRARASEALSEVGLGGLEEKNYQHLSEGQKQLCILARTFIEDSLLLLLDEPESALDIRCRYRMLYTLKRWVKSGERTALVTLHDPTLALTVCDTLIFLDNGQVAGKCSTGYDSPEYLETLLRKIYGNVRLLSAALRDGKSRLALFYDEDALTSSITEQNN